MNENLEKLKMLCDKINYTGNTSSEFLFTASCVDYFYFFKNMGINDVSDGLVDGANDGGIDFIYTDSDKIYLIQGKSSNSMSYNDVRDALFKIAETFENLVSKRYLNYSDRLTRAFVNNYEMFRNEPNVEFVLFTKSEFNESDKVRIAELSSDIKFENYTITVYDNSDIRSKVLSVDQGQMTVQEFKLEIDKPGNHLEYDDGRGSIFTIKASSLKCLYIKCRDKGLFGYNLRDHISDKKVDSDIDLTIKNKKDSFWFLNNGITIACSDYVPDGNMLKLYDFSIINGAQTTFKVGNSKLIDPDYDFSIVCKVVKSKNSLSDDFIRKISEASNSQKPIKPRDLRANSREQQLLQKLAADNGKYSLAIDIKRGVKPSNIKKINNPWQRIMNEYLGQLMLACFYQHPGSARSAKADIFGKEKTYNTIFSFNKVSDYDYNSIFDLVRISKSYDDFKIDYSQEIEKKIEESSSELEKLELNNYNSVCQNGKFVVLALLFYFYKRHYLKYAANDPRIFEEELRGSLSLEYEKEDYFSKINYFFRFVVENLSYVYNNNQVSLKLTSYSNFFKTDSNYTDVIIPAFEKKYKDQFDSIKIVESIKIFEKI